MLLIKPGIHCEPLAKEVDGILVPPPPNMVEVSDFSDKYRTLMKAAPVGTFGLYFPTDQYLKISNGEPIISSQMAHARHSEFTRTTAEEAALVFEKEMNILQKDLAKDVHKRGTFKNLVREGSRRVEANLPYLRVEMEGSTVLDVDFSTPSQGAFILASQQKAVVNGRILEFTAITSSAWVRIGRTVIHLTYAANLDDEETPARVKDSMQKWITSIVAKNTR